MSMTREEAIVVIWNRCQHCKQTEEAIKVLKSERPHGEWGKRTYGYLSTHDCSNCGFNGNQLWHFCPNCGSDNRKRGEAE